MGKTIKDILESSGTQERIAGKTQLVADSIHGLGHVTSQQIFDDIEKHWGGISVLDLLDSLEILKQKGLAEVRKVNYKLTPTGEATYK